MVPGHYQVVASRLAGTVGAARVVAALFGKKTLGAKAPVHLVGGNMVEADILPRSPGLPCSIQKGPGSHNVGPDKGFRIVYGTVHMAFGGKVDHRIYPVFAKKRFYRSTIGNIDLPETVAGITLKIGKVHQVPCIGKGIDVYHPPGEADRRREKIADKVGADKAGPAGHKDCVHPVSLFLQCYRTLIRYKASCAGS